MYSRWRHPPKTVSPRPYCRSLRGRNGLGSETKPVDSCYYVMRATLNGSLLSFDCKTENSKKTTESDVFVYFVTFISKNVRQLHS